MNDATLWSAIFLSGAIVLLMLPFYPAWSEWRHPCDEQTVPASLSGQSAESSADIALLPGATFRNLQAKRIQLGSGPMPLPEDLPDLHRWQPPPEARAWGSNGWNIGHRLNIPARQCLPCSLVVRGPLSIHGPGLIQGDLKARENLQLGSGVRVQGHVFCEGDIWIASGCAVAGLVLAEGALHVEPGVVIGLPGQPVSVCADAMVVRGPVVVHGSVQAKSGARVSFD